MGSSMFCQHFIILSKKFVRAANCPLIKNKQQREMFGRPEISSCAERKEETEEKLLVRKEGFFSSRMGDSREMQVPEMAPLHC